MSIDQLSSIKGNDVAAGDEPNEYLYGVGFASEEGGLDIFNTRDKRYCFVFPLLISNI